MVAQCMHMVFGSGVVVMVLGLWCDGCVSCFVVGYLWFDVFFFG